MFFETIEVPAPSDTRALVYTYYSPTDSACDSLPEVVVGYTPGPSCSGASVNYCGDVNYTSIIYLGPNCTGEVFLNYTEPLQPMCTFGDGVYNTLTCESGSIPPPTPTPTPSPTPTPTPTPDPSCLSSISISQTENNQWDSEGRLVTQYTISCMYAVGREGNEEEYNLKFHIVTFSKPVFSLELLLPGSEGNMIAVYNMNKTGNNTYAVEDSRLSSGQPIPPGILFCSLFSSLFRWKYNEYAVQDYMLSSSQPHESPLFCVVIKF